MLAKMVGMLGSDQDGEVLNAVRAIRRLTQATVWPNFRMSEKQAKWFAFLFDKYGDRE